MQHACETTNAIIKDLDNGFFSILVDESRDISMKEQMAVILLYVDKKGIVTTNVSLKVVIKSLFCRHDKLSLSRQLGKC